MSVLRQTHAHRCLILISPLEERGAKLIYTPPNVGTYLVSACSYQALGKWSSQYCGPGTTMIRKDSKDHNSLLAPLLPNARNRAVSVSGSSIIKEMPSRKMEVPRPPRIRYHFVRKVTGKRLGVVDVAGLSIIHMRTVQKTKTAIRSRSGPVACTNSLAFRSPPPQPICNSVSICTLFVCQPRRGSSAHPWKVPILHEST
jgi:hypothetical protein